MRTQIWLALIASSAFAPGLGARALTQIDRPESQAVGPRDVQRVIPTQSNVHGSPGLLLHLPQKPASLASGGLQYQTQMDSVADPSSKTSTFITFDAPGAGTGANQGTYPVAIDAAGTITGDYLDASNVVHGFVRSTDCNSERHGKDCNGTITALDAPGAGTGANQGTYPLAINDAGVITGSYTDASDVSHGFVRSTDCGSEGHDWDCTETITTFDAPGAGTSAFQGTSAAGINSVGAITGSYIDENSVFHGFLRTRDGAFTTFDPPSSTFTFSVGINPSGAITGFYSDASGFTHGFLRRRDGAITPFDVPGADPQLGTAPAAISPDGAITGNYFAPIVGNPFGGNFRGFLRERDGDFVTFDAATYAPCCIWTFPTAINTAGAITGYDNDGHNLNHGFLRTRDGTVITFEAPGAGTGDLEGTLAFGINSAGTITGNYIDASKVTHGFLREKSCETEGDDPDCDAEPR